MGTQNSVLSFLVVLHLIYLTSAQQTTTCTSSTCGQNGQCQMIDGEPVCSCFRGYTFDPINLCTRSECLYDNECSDHLTCKNGKCIDVCSGICGAYADCQASRHVPVCTCPPGYTGNPFSNCRRFDPSALCHPSPCGANTNCVVVGGVPTCKCQPGFQGSPLSGCRHECEGDSECTANQTCIDFKCQNPCLSQCAESADCVIRNHRAVCTCPKNYIGNPQYACNPECYSDVHCPPSHPGCFDGICKNPCDGVCGTGAECNLRGLTPVCSCPKDMTGNPFVSCRPFTDQVLCEPNPCGANAYCEPRFEKRDPLESYPFCFCPTGFLGDPLAGCRREEYVEDANCPNCLPPLKEKSLNSNK